MGFRIIAVVAVCICAGCSTYNDQVQDFRSSYFRGDLENAEQVASEVIENSKSDASLYQLDSAMIQLFSGDLQKAESSLRKVRDRFDVLEQKQLGEQLQTLVTDDSTKPYGGADHEKVMIRALLTLTSLVRNDGDAYAYALQIQEKEAQLYRRASPIDAVNNQETSINQPSDPADSNPRSNQDAQKSIVDQNQNRSAVGPYVRAILRESTGRDYQEAAQLYSKVAELNPEMKSIQQDIQRAKFGAHSQKGNGVVYVFSFVGRGPFKVERSEQPTSNALLIADQILSSVSDHSLPPTIAPIKVPVVAEQTDSSRFVQVSVGGRTSNSEVLSDIGRLAVKQNELALDQTIARAVVRRVVKKAAIYAGKDAIDSDNSIVDFALNMVGVAWEASEKADLRCWSLLPDQIQVTRIELPIGVHELELECRSNHMKSHPQKNANPKVRVNVRDRRNTFVLANFPDFDAVGNVLCSDLAE